MVLSLPGGLHPAPPASIDPSPMDLPSNTNLLGTFFSMVKLSNVEYLPFSYAI